MNDQLIIEQKGHIGLVTLNRPKALNALTLDMIHSLQKQLALWQDDPSVHAVVIKPSEGRAFCAGGDIRWLYEKGKAEDPIQMTFFLHEYRLNYFISQFKKPYIAWMDGITMGGGVGISMHGSHPIATERFRFAMPETGIGFFPDIGASHLLSRCPDKVGRYLALTGSRLTAEDALALNLVKGTMASHQMSDFIEALVQTDLSKQADTRVNQLIHEFQNPDREISSSLPQASIAKIFDSEKILDILSGLKKQPDAWHQKTHEILSQKAPLSLCVTLRQMILAEKKNLSECLQTDLDLVAHFMKDHDFYEGVRALIIDKDNQPRWEPDTFLHVNEEKTISYFERVNELTL